MEDGGGDGGGGGGGGGNVVMVVGSEGVQGLVIKGRGVPYVR